jgi:hypothetical protein
MIIRHFPAEVHHFIFVVTLIPIVDGYTDVALDPIGLAIYVDDLDPYLYCVGALINEVIGCFPFSLT